jgi:hypothetical protein
MFSRKSRIKLGKPEAAMRATAAAGGRLAPADPPGGTLAAPPTDRSGRGFSLLRDRVAAASSFEASLESAKPQVNPVLLIAAVCALAVLLIALILAPRGAPAVDHPAVIRDYTRYRNSKPGTRLPTPEELQQSLTDAEFLENTGRRAEARRTWQEILITTGNDQSNPLRDLASRRLNDLK